MFGYCSGASAPVPWFPGAFGVPAACNVGVVPCVPRGTVGLAQEGCLLARVCGVWGCDGCECESVRTAGGGKRSAAFGRNPFGSKLFGKRCLGNKIVRVRARLIRSCCCHLMIACVEIRRNVASLRAHRSLCVRARESMCAVMGTRDVSAVFITLAFVARARA